MSRDGTLPPGMMHGDESGPQYATCEHCGNLIRGRTYSIGVHESLCETCWRELKEKAEEEI